MDHQAGRLYMVLRHDSIRVSKVRASTLASAIQRSTWYGSVYGSHQGP